MKQIALLFLAASLTAAPPAYKDLKYPALKEVKIPSVPTYTLPNGIKLYLLENHELPLVGGFALLHAGSVFDPPEKVGLAELTGAVLRTGGTKSKSGDQIDVELEDVAASVESNLSLTSGKVSFSCLKENTDQVLAIFHDLLTSPEFRQDKFDLAKSQYRSGIARRNDDAGGILGREFNDLIYGKSTPYGREMEYATLDAITREDLIEYHRRYFFPANTVIAVQGDFQAAEMKSKIEALFADWNVKQPPVPPLPPITAKPSPGVYLASKPDVTQSFFEVGHMGGMLKDKDYPALEVAADILGGGFSSRLFRNVRTARGLAYSISATWGANFEIPGVFRFGGSTKSASTVDAINAARAEVEKIRTTEVSPQELKTAQDTVLNSFVFNFDSPGKTLGRVVTYDYYGYPKDFLLQYQKAIAAVTQADVLRVAKQYFKPELLTTVVVGKPEDFGKPLSDLGPVHNIDLTIPEAKQAVATQDGKPLLVQVQKAMGGADALAAIKDVVQTSEVKIHAGQGVMAAKQTTYYLMPSTLRQNQELPFGKITAYYDGKTNWLITPQGQMPMPPEVVKQVQTQMFRQLLTLLLSDRNPARTVAAVNDHTLQIKGENGLVVQVEIDPKSGLPVSESYTEGGRAIKESYAGWKPTAGLQLPTIVTIDQDGQRYADVTVSSWAINTGLKPEDLSKKP